MVITGISEKQAD